MAELRAPTLALPEQAPARGGATGKMRGRQKAAILLVALGPERAAQLFNHLHDEEIEALSLEMAKTQRVPPETTETIMEEAVATTAAMGYIGRGGFAYARAEPGKAIRPSRAAGVLSRQSPRIALA